MQMLCTGQAQTTYPLTCRQYVYVSSYMYMKNTLQFIRIQGKKGTRRFLQMNNSCLKLSALFLPSKKILIDDHAIVQISVQLQKQSS